MYASSLPPSDFSQEFPYAIQTRRFLCAQLNFPVAIFYRIKNYVCLQYKSEVNAPAEANRGEWTAVLSFTAAGNLALAVTTFKIEKTKDNALTTRKSKWCSNSNTGLLFGLNRAYADSVCILTILWKDITDTLKISFLSRSRERYILFLLNYIQWAL